MGDVLGLPESIQKFILFVLAAAAGSGGVMYWIDRWRARVRLFVRIVEIDALFFKFEIENLGRQPVSIRREAWLTAYVVSDEGCTLVRVPVEIHHADRVLPPHTPRALSGFISEDQDNSYQKIFGKRLSGIELVLPRYTFCPSWGALGRFYGIKHSQGFSIRTKKHIPSIGPFRYWIDVVLLRLRREVADLDEDDGHE